MKRTALTAFLGILLCLLLSAALAETRQGTISLEGMEEPIEETLYESPQGFSFWYVSDRLKAYQGEADGIEGVVVQALYSDDHMVLSIISEKDALAYIKAQDEDAPRAQLDVYRELKNGTYHFLTLIAENGRYLRAVGRYSQEAAEGNAKFFQLALDSASLISEYDAAFLRELPGQWSETYEGTTTVLTLKEDGEMTLTFSGGDGAFVYSYQGVWFLGPSTKYGRLLTFRFTSTDNPKHAESDYGAECAWAAYTESWVENDTQITYLLLNPQMEGTGVSPFEEVTGSTDAALHREQGPNMRVVNCKEYVSLREARSTSSKRLAKVPLGALVLAFPEYGAENGFISCVYQDQEGFILAQYLAPVE